MYGIDPITRQCVYKTPCGWCARLEGVCSIELKSLGTVKGLYKMCVYLKDGRCMGTKEMDFCKEDKCTNIKFK